MNDAVTVIFAWEIVERRLQRADGLVKCGIANSMHLNLQSCAVRFLAKIRHNFVTVIQHAASALGIGVRLKQRGIVASEAAIKRAGEATTDARQLAADCHINIQRLGKHAHLKARLRALPHPLLQADIQVAGKANAAYGVHHANAATGQKIHCTLNVFHQFRDRKAVCNVIAHREKCLLVHLARFGVIAPQVFHLIIDFRQKRTVHHTGMAVVFHHENRLVRACLIELCARQKASFFHGIRRSTKRNKRFRRAPPREIGNHFLDFTV